MPASARDRDRDHDSGQSLTCAVTLRREGSRGWVRVTGRLTPLARRHLDDWLDWLITTGARQVTVSLATAEQIDGACLLVLRVARARLRSRDGELIVTAGRAPVRAALTVDEVALPRYRPSAPTGRPDRGTPLERRRKIERT